MAGYLGFLSGLIDLQSLNYATGIPLSTLQKYARGDYRPSADRLKGLQKVYSKIQTTRLRVAGLSYKEAKRFSTMSKSSVNKTIKNVNTVVSFLAQKADVAESVIRAGMQDSDKTAEEIFGSGTE